MTDSEKEQRINQLYGERSKYAKDLEQYKAALKICYSLRSEVASCNSSISEARNELKTAMVIGKKEPDNWKLEDAFNVGTDFQNDIYELEGILSEKCVKLKSSITECDYMIAAETKNTEEVEG